MAETSAHASVAPSQPGSAPRRLGNMLRRYSVGQAAGPMSTSPPTDTPLGNAPSPPSSPTRSAFLRRSSEGQAPATSPGGRTGRLAPLRAAAASVFQSTRSALTSDSSTTPPVENTSPISSFLAQDAQQNDAVLPPGQTHRVRLVPFLDMTRSLLFVPTEIELRENGHAVQIGRFSERLRPEAPSDAEITTHALEVSTDSVPANVAQDQAVSTARATAASVNREQTRITFKSKVVSRLHAELWCETGGKVYIRDTKSSSGTFLNHMRLSPAGSVSRPFPLKDGDVLQFGVDYQGGVQELYRCIKLRIELNHNTRLQPTSYGTNMLRQLQSMQPEMAQTSTETAPHELQSVSEPAARGAPTPTPGSAAARPPGPELTECCICLFKIRVCQALFIAPCSHIFHYKCIRRLLTLHHPGFSCPLCRTFVNLEEDVEVDEEEGRLSPLRDAPTRIGVTSNSDSVPDAAMDTSGSANEMHSAPNSPLPTSFQETQGTQPLHAITEQESPALEPTHEPSQTPSVAHIQTPFGVVPRPG